MADFPFRGDGHSYKDYGKVVTDSVATTMTTLTAPTGNNAKGDWLEIVPSLAINAKALMIHTLQATVSGRSYLIDIGIGTAGNEVVLAANLLVTIGTPTTSKIFHLPLLVPAYSRLSARYQTEDITNDDIRLAITAIEGTLWGNPSFSRMVTIGAVTADSGGTGITPVNGSKGNYAALTASSSQDIFACIIAFCTSGADYTLNDTGYDVDLSIGPASNETVILPDIMVHGNSVRNAYEPPITPLLPIQIPAGSRIAARASGSSTADPIDIVLYGFN
jgi:hypothetical protein